MQFQKIIDFILKRRWFFIVLIGISTILSDLFTLKNLSVNNSLSIWFLDDNPDYQDYIHFQETQGSDEIIIALIPVDDALKKENMNVLYTLHNQLDSLPFVNSTFSLANAKYPMYVRKKIRYHSIYNVDKSRNDLVGLLDKMPVFKEQLISQNGKALMFYVQLKSITEIEDIRADAVKTIEGIITENTSSSTAISGAPILNESYNKTVYGETIFFAGLTILVILLTLFLLLSNRFYILAGLLSVIIPIAFLLGLMSFFGVELNLILMLIPTVLMVYCLSDALHILMIFDKHIKKHPEESLNVQIKNALQKSLKPCFYTTITTLIGYFALYLSPLPAFKSMGIFASLGLLMAFILVYIILTIILSFSTNPNESTAFATNAKYDIGLNNFLVRLNNFTTRRAVFINLGALIVFIVGVFCLTKIEVNSDALDLLGDGKVKTDLHTIEESLQGSTRLQLNITSEDKSILMSDEFLTNLRAFQNDLDKNELVSSPVSLLNIQSFMEKRTPALFRLNKPKNIDSLFLKSRGESNSFFSLVSDDFSSVNISLNIKELKTKELNFLLNDIQNDFQKSFSSSEYGLKIQGFSYVYSKLNDFIMETQFRSFSTAFLVSFLVLFFFIRNMRITLMALVPNILPLSMLVIVMVIFDIPLDTSTAMIAPIMLGISMDDTIHFIYNYKRFLKDGDSLESANNATKYTGKALISTTLILCLGFLIISLSGVKSVSNFGFLCGFAVFTALISDIVVLPALLKRFG